MLSNPLLLFTFLFLVILGFWQVRKQHEYALKYAQSICQKHQLQFLDLARKRERIVWRSGPVWKIQFQFGFSGDGESRYEGILIMHHLTLSDYELPLYRLPPEPPENNVHKTNSYEDKMY